MSDEDKVFLRAFRMRRRRAGKMNFAKAVWKFLSGKKTVIAALAGLVLSWAQAKGWISGEDAVYLASGLTVVTGVAVGHKGLKAVQKP